MRVAFDTENTALLNSSSIDYTQSPYKLKSDFKMHCIVCTDIDTLQVHRFVGEEVKTKFPKFLDGVTQLIGWNNINYDNLVLKLYLGIDYTIGPDTINGRPCQIDDGMVLSKTLNPDRLGHSIEWWGERLGFPKIDWRAEAISLGLIKPNDPPGAEFQTFHPRMVDYCERDTLITAKAYKALMEEWGNWNWQDAYDLEKAVAEIITRQEHRGFHFDIELAKSNVEELDRMMEEIRSRIEPMIPPKKPTKKVQGEYTPPKVQFKKDGSPSSNLEKFAAKLGGTIHQDDEGGYSLLWNGRVHDLPLPAESLVTEVPATLADTTHIKEWLVSLGWVPTAFKERDLTVDSRKKKISKEKFKEVVDRYVEQTLESNFCSFRCEHLDVPPENLKQKLLEHNLSKPLKVLTNPNFTVGQDKELCPGLEKIGDEFPHAKDIANWLTYRHRRNSILGGGVDVEEDEEEFNKGYLGVDRIFLDGRIPTPADTCGCNTGRFKHRLVANIPRLTSPYGENMRRMFAAGPGYYQLGYDGDGLEARIEGHYTYKYTGGPEYAESLVAAKPNDIHTVTAARIGIPRNDAKTLKYACVPVDNTQVLTEDGWKWYSELREGDVVLSYNDRFDRIEKDQILKLHYFENEDVVKFSNKYDSFECTLDHKWYGWKRIQHNNKRFNAKMFFYANEINQETNILISAPYYGSGNITPDEAGIIAWILSDGYLKWSDKGDGTSCSNGKRKQVTVRISQAKHKFHAEIKRLLDNSGLDYSVSEQSMNGTEMYHFLISSPSARDFLDRVIPGRRDKHEEDWVKWVLTLNRDSLQSFIHNFWLADGNVKGNENSPSMVITQNPGNILDAVSLAMYLTGRKVTVTKHTGNAKTIRSQSRRHITCQELQKEEAGKRDVFCLTTGNGTFIIKQPKYMGITGNCSYGAQPPKIAKQMGWPLARAKRVFEGFWNAAKPLQLLKENLEKYWEGPGKREFVLGIDGRKVPTRSKHALLNSLFQSAGLICMKRGMVFHDRWLKEAGLIVDFFREDWQNKTFAQQMIHYHDEAQFELSKSLVKFKMFATEEEAKAFKEEGKVWSDVGHAPDGRYYRAYSIVGELASKAITEAGKYYKLNVELTAGYQIGRNWANCH